MVGELYRFRPGFGIQGYHGQIFIYLGSSYDKDWGIFLTSSGKKINMEKYNVEVLR